MKAKDYIIAGLFILVVLSAFDACENRKAIKKSKGTIETLRDSRKGIEKELTNVSNSLTFKLDSIQKEKEKDSINFLVELLKVDRLNKVKVKKVLLKGVKPNKDTLELLNFTLRESKEILRKVLKQEGVISQQGFKIESYKIETASLNRSVVLKDMAIESFKSEVEQSEIILKQTKKKHRKTVVKVGAISFGVGAVLVAILK